jgi:hypothetical protein
MPDEARKPSGGEVAGFHGVVVPMVQLRRPVRFQLRTREKSAKLMPLNGRGILCKDAGRDEAVSERD